MFDELPSLAYDQGKFGDAGAGSTASGGRDISALSCGSCASHQSRDWRLCGDRACISPEFWFANIPSRRVCTKADPGRRASPLAQSPRRRVGSSAWACRLRCRTHPSVAVGLQVKSERLCLECEHGGSDQPLRHQAGARTHRCTGRWQSSMLSLHSAQMGPIRRLAQPLNDRPDARDAP